MKKIKSLIFIFLGLISLVMGIVGIILPILPTVPFLLLTSFFFAKGSEKFNRWFLSTKIYQKHLDGFVKNKVMTIKSELLLLSLVSLMLFSSMWLIDKLIVSIVLTILIVIKYLYFIFSIKTVSKKEYLKIKSLEKEVIR